MVGIEIEVMMGLSAVCGAAQPVAHVATAAKQHKTPSGLRGLVPTLLGAHVRAYVLARHCVAGGRSRQCVLYRSVLSASALTFCSEKLLVTLRDGRKLVGILRSFDQFGT